MYIMFTAIYLVEFE